MCKILVWQRDLLFWHQILRPILPSFLSTFCAVNTKSIKSISFEHTLYYPSVEEIKSYDLVIIDQDDINRNAIQIKEFTSDVIRIGYQVECKDKIIDKGAIFKLFFDSLRDSLLSPSDI